MYEIFAQLLKEKGLTAYKVSKDTGIPNTTLSAWKRGVSNLKADKVKIIADYLGVSVAYLMGLTNIPNEEINVEEAQKEISKLEANIQELNRKIKILEQEKAEKDNLIKSTNAIIDKLKGDNGNDIADRLTKLTPEQTELFFSLLEQFENKNK